MEENVDDNDDAIESDQTHKLYPGEFVMRGQEDDKIYEYIYRVGWRLKRGCDGAACRVCLWVGFEVVVVLMLMQAYIDV